MVMTDAGDTPCSSPVFVGAIWLLGGGLTGGGYSVNCPGEGVGDGNRLVVTACATAATVPASTPERS
jgi:hypothetical protein